MYLARRAMLLVGIAIIAMAVVGSPASAQTVEVTNEGSGTHCSPCAIHETGEMLITGHSFGIEATVSDCNVELVGTINEDGEGATEADLTDHAPANDCTVFPCKDAMGNKIPWTTRIFETNSTTRREREWCWESMPGGVHRRVHHVSLMIEGGSHDHEIDDSDVTGMSPTGGPPAEFTGELEMEVGGSEIAVAHIS